MTAAGPKAVTQFGVVNSDIGMEVTCKNPRYRTFIKWKTVLSLRRLFGSVLAFLVRSQNHVSRFFGNHDGGRVGIT